MATEHEIDRMVVRLVGNQEDYQKMLKDVEKQTKESADWAEEQGSRITKAFSSAFRSAQGMVSSVGRTAQRGGAAMAGAGGLVTAPLGKAALDFSKQGKEIQKLVLEYQKLSKEAEFLQKRTLKNTEAYKELERVQKLNEKQASVFINMSERTGTSIEDLTKTIKVNSDEFKKWEEELEEFGLTMDKEAVKKATDLADSWTRVRQSMRGMWSQVGSAVASNFQEFNELIEGTVRWTVQWVKENKELISTVADVAGKLVIVGSVLGTIGSALTVIAPLAGPIAAGLTAAAAAWLAWDTATGNMVRGEASQMWDRYADSIKGVYNTIQQYGRQIIDYVDSVMTGVFDAIKAGNLELAVEIAWTGAKVAWSKAMDEIDDLTGNKFSEIFKNLSSGNFKAAFEGLVTDVLILWTQMLQKLDPIFVDIMNRGSEIWTSIANAADTASVAIQDAVGLVKAAFKDAAAVIKMVWDNLGTFFEGFSTLISGGVGKGITNLAKGLWKFAGDAAYVFGFINDQITGMATETMNFFKDTDQQAVDGIKAARDKMAEGAKGLDLSLGMDMDWHSKREAEKRKKRQEELADRKKNRGSMSEEEQAQRLVDLYMRQAKYAVDLAALEKKRQELQEQGNKEAAENLAIQEETLRKAIEQAEQERKAFEEKKANGAETAQSAEDKRQIDEDALRLENERQRVIERFDPVEKYRRQKKELEAMFEAGERGGKVFQKAMESIEDELKNAKWQIDFKFGVTGMDAVRGNTREAQRLMQNTLEQLEKEKAAKEGIAEADKRNKEAGEGKGPGMKPDGKGGVDKAAQNDEKKVKSLDEMNNTLREIRDKEPIQLQPAGLD